MPETSSWFTQWFWIHLGIGEDLSNLLDLHQFLRGWTSKHPSIQNPLVKHFPSSPFAAPAKEWSWWSEWSQTWCQTPEQRENRTLCCEVQWFGSTQSNGPGKLLFFSWKWVYHWHVSWIWQEKGSWDFNSQSLQSPPNLEASLDAVPHFLILTSISSYCIISWGLVPPNHPCS